MAKEEIVVEEEVVEPAQTLEDAFNNVEDDVVEVESDEKVDDAAEVEADEAKTEPDADDDTTEAATEEVVVDDATEKPTEKSWGELGLKRFEGMSRQEVATRLYHEDLLNGMQKNELGATRKEIIALKAAQATKTEKPDEVKKNVIDSMPAMTEGQTTDFNALWDTNPMQAIFKYGGDTMKQMIQEEIQSSMGGDLDTKVNDIVSGQTEQLKVDNFFVSNPDYEAVRSTMSFFDQPENLGDQNRDCLDLAKLSKLANDKDAMYPPTYRLMKKYPNMTFDDALKFSTQVKETPEAAKKKREAIEKTVKKIDAANTTTKKKTPESIPIFDNIDKAFDSVRDG